MSHRFIAPTLLLLAALSVGAGEGSASFPAVKDLPVRTAMPDPLVADNGQKVTTAGQWKQRREEMKRIMEE